MKHTLNHRDALMHRSLAPLGRSAALALAGLITTSWAHAQAPVQLETLVADAKGVEMLGAQPSDRAGWVANALSAVRFGGTDAGDANLDGIDDILIAAPFADPEGRADAGEVYVVFGSSSPSPSLDLDAIRAGTPGLGYVIRGAAINDLAGYTAEAVGDVNGDGRADILVGAPTAAASHGRSYIVFGKSNETPVELSAVASGTGGFVIRGDVVNTLAGASVAGLGDVNSDGLADFAVSSWGSKRAFVIFGKADTNPIDLANIPATVDGFVIGDSTGSASFAYRVGGAGDVNNDGMNDILVTDPTATVAGLVSAGKAFVVFGKNNTAPVDCGMPFGGFAIHGEVAGGLLGYSASGLGDMNNDNRNDVVIGSPYADVGPQIDAGKAFVVFGKDSDSTVDLAIVSSGASSLGFAITGRDTSDFSAFSVSGLGDINGDSRVDMLIAAFGGDPDGKNFAGESYVVYGKTDGAAIALASVAAGSGGFVINGAAPNHYSGYSAGSAGDFNNDGRLDLIVGAPYADVGVEIQAGRVYLVFGTGPVSIPPSTGSGSTTGTTTGGDTTAGTTTGGTTTGGSSTGATTTGGTSTGSATTAGTATGSSTLAPSLEWDITVKKPSAGKSVRYKSDKGLKVTGFVETDLDQGSDDVKVRLAVQPKSATNAPEFVDATKVKTVNKKGIAKFTAKNLADGLDLESGDEFNLLIQAASNSFTSAVTVTQTLSYEVK